MLRLLRDRYRVGLSQDALAIKPQRRLHQRSNVLADQLITISSDDRVDWERALGALDAWLGQLSRPRASIDVVISNVFLRYAVVPWNRVLTDRAEVEALIRIRLAAMFGDEVRDWLVVIDRREFEGGMVACAIDPALVDRLRAICLARQVKLCTVAPEFMVRYNQWRGRLSVGPLAFAQVADGRCHVAYRDAKGWRSIRAVHMPESCEQTLIQVIDRELILQGCDEDVAIYVDLPATWSSVLGRIPARIEVLAEYGEST